VKKFVRPERTASQYDISPASFYDGLAKGTIPLKRIQILDRAVAFDEDDILLHQLGLIADRDGLTGAKREAWIDAEFIKQKAIAERVAEYRARTEHRRPRGMHAKKLVEACG
jgi:hypothetical protein